MRGALVAAMLALAATQVAARPRTYLVSLDVPLRANEYMDKFSIDTWGVEMVAVCHFPLGWRLTVGSDASPSGIIAGEGGNGVTWLDHQRLARELRSLVLVRLVAPIDRQRVEFNDGSGYRPATFDGTAELGTYGGTTAGRNVHLTYANVRLAPASLCPASHRAEGLGRACCTRSH